MQAVTKIPFTVRTIKPNSLYKHYKGATYKVDLIAKHTETEEDLVIYHDVTKPERIWARPLTMFNEYVVIDSITKRRFESVS